MRNTLKLLAIITSCLLLASCASWFTGKPRARQVDVNVVAARSINANILGTSSPIAIDVYQLSDAADFSSSNYQAFLDGTVKNVVQKKTYLVWPGKSKKMRLRLAENTKVIGVVANYRILNNKQWHLTESIGWFTCSIDIKVNKNGIVED
jgi:type VI secretion system VasD/TssJ family lipoprotein